MPIHFTVGSSTITIPDVDRTTCEVWSRVMGYYRPVDQWNVGKQQEFKERTNYQNIHPHP